MSKRDQNRNTKGLKPFKPGQSGNPSGRAKIPPEIRAFRAMAYRDFVEQVHVYWAMTPEQLNAEMKRLGTSNFDLTVANLVKAGARGDAVARRELLERLWGKVKDNIEISHQDLDERLERVNQDKIIELLREAKE